MSDAFDLVVLGSGVAGLSAAYGGKAKGWKTAVVESAAFGGTCENRGCEPKKVMMGVAEIQNRMRLLGDRGIFSPTGISWPELMTFKRSFTDPVSEKTRKGLESSGIAVFEGEARFSGANSLRVGKRTLSAPRILIATGASPAPLGIEGADLVALSDEFLSMEKLPESVAFIGGGYISFEFAQIAAMAGAKVTILHSGASPLARFDREIVTMAMENMKDMGIRFVLDKAVRSVERKGKKFIVRAGSGGEEVVEADRVFHGAGRRPNLDLDLEKAGIECRDGVLSLSPGLRTSNSSVWAAGDVNARGLPLTPVATKEALAVLANMDGGAEVPIDYSRIPTVVFTLPTLAQVGIGQTEAEKRGLKVTVKSGKTEDWYGSRRMAFRHSGFKTVVESGSGKILGVSLLASGAEEVINIFALAIAQGLRVEDLKDMVWAFPTTSSDIEYFF